MNECVLFTCKWILLYFITHLTTKQHQQQQQKKNNRKMCVYLLLLSCLVELDWKMNYFMPG